MSTRLKRVQLLACLGSLAVVLLCRGIESAIGRIPYDTTDSMGRAMGFNDRFSQEHWGILLRTIDWQDYRFEAQALDSGYFWLSVLMHFAAVGWILRGDPLRLRTPLVFLGVQVLAFPLGLLGLVILPAVFADVIRGNFDREGIIDLPFLAVTGHTVWLLTCLGSVLMIFIHQRRTAWRRLKEASRIPREA
jgi:hypothetical protein